MDMRDKRHIEGPETNVAAIVLAGGRGTRMRSDIPKQYLMLSGYPLLYYALKAFQESCVKTIVLVCGKGEITYCRKNIVEKYGFDKVKFIVEGGAERYHSVYQGLSCIKDSSYVLIHDGARPFVTGQMISDNLKTAIEKDACVTGVPSKDTVKISDGNGCVASTPDRKNVWLIQTPQTFKTSLILQAYEKLIKQPAINVTDDAMVAETVLGIPVYFVMGDYRNIKITTPEDLKIAEVFLEDLKKDSVKNTSL